MKATSGNFFDNIRQNPSQLMATMILGAAIVLLLVNIVVVTFQSANDKQYISYAGELRVLSQEIAKNASEAADGKPEAFALLKNSRDDFDRLWQVLSTGNTDLDKAPEDAGVAMQQVGILWNGIRINADKIVENEEIVLQLHEVATTLSETIPQLQVEYEDVVSILLDSQAPSDQIVFAQRQSLLAERIVRSVAKLLEGGEGAVKATEQFGTDAGQFRRVLQGMIDGNVAMQIERVEDEDALDSLAEISELFEFVSNSVDEIIETSPELFGVRQSANDIFANSQEFLQATSGLTERFEKLSDEHIVSDVSAIILVFIILGTIIILSVLFTKEAQVQSQVSAAKNERNQNAILRLLDELADLADGDLTVTATVSEDFTGAIADSINFAIDQLRSLVYTINETSLMVSSAAQETQATAMHLAEAAEHQAQEIAGASAAINEMAVSIDQVSSNAVESAGVAERSVTIAKTGTEMVQNTINGMDTIREQIQETSKRIKRLGESSQEIGDIVSLINDIADQTNILSLNAAIQASMAGDAGRGFAVVADEVQRLAERSSAATKQIEALVKTIQSDTNEAVISMEHTTAEVVRGARLAQDAGVALEEIETVSTNLSDLIQNISNAARQQASSAGHISNTMNVIQEITSQTSAGTNATAESIGNLAELASRMREGVAGFKIPDTSELSV